MKLADLVEFFCSFIEKTDVRTFKDVVIECVIHKNKTTVVFGTDGEFHYLNTPGFEEEKQKVHYYAKNYDGADFDKLYETKLPEGYWVYQYSTLVNFYEFKWFEGKEEAQMHYDDAKITDDDLLLEKALLYIGKNKQECIAYQKG